MHTPYQVWAEESRAPLSRGMAVLSSDSAALCHDNCLQMTVCRWSIVSSRASAASPTRALGLSAERLVQTITNYVVLPTRILQKSSLMPHFNPYNLINQVLVLSVHTPIGQRIGGLPARLTHHMQSAGLVRIRQSYTSTACRYTPMHAMRSDDTL